MFFKKDNIKRLGIIIGIFLISFLILIWVLELWRADFRVPFNYYGDALFYGMIIKGIIDNGWHLRNSFIGMPEGALMYDFTESYNLHMLVIKGLSLFTNDWALVMNIFFLLTFPITTLCSFTVFRKFGISYLPSISGSLIYTFLPYHFYRNEGHLILAAYYIIPLMIMIILWVALGEIPSSNRKKNITIDSKIIWSIFVCLLIASSGVYYPYFACSFLGVAGIIAFCKKEKRKSFFFSIFLIVLIIFFALINLSPSIIYQYKNGKNYVFTTPRPYETEQEGLKIIQLLLPVDGHRISFFAKLKDFYNNTAPLVGENRSASLGIVGSIGFILLILSLFLKNGFSKNDRDEIIKNLSLLNITGILYGSIRGFGSIFSYSIFSRFRSINRISTYIAFFSIFIVVIILDDINKKYVKSKIALIIYVGFIIIVTFAGILDQTNKNFIPPYEKIKTDYKNDAHFVNKIENTLTPNSMVFQIPYIDFPESPPHHHIQPYELLKGYLHSKTLRWSYGTMRGRENSMWQKWVTLKPIDDFLESIALAGFKGIYLDRYGYTKKEAYIEKELQSLLNTPIISENNRLVFFDMRDYSKVIKNKYAILDEYSKIHIKKRKQPIIIPCPQDTGRVKYHIDILKEIKDYIEISGWAFIEGESSENSEIYLILRSINKDCYFLKTSIVKRFDVTRYFKSLNLDDSGFSRVIAKEELETGDYQLGIFIKKNNTQAIKFTEKVIKIGLNNLRY